MADTATPLHGTGPERRRGKRCGRIIAVAGPEVAALADRLPNRTASGSTAAVLAQIATLRPRAVAVALFSMSYDVLDLAEGLARIGFAGRVLALSPPLPNRRLVQRELASQVPGLRFRLVTMAALAQRDGG